MPRLDHLLVERGLAGSGARAQAMILAGLVRVRGRTDLKPGMDFPDSEPVEIVAGLPYVSRGGEKLAGVLDTLSVPVSGRACVDVGASTGGFTDCLLQRGATAVLAIDVGRHQLHEQLRRDPRVTSWEKTHVRDVTCEKVAAWAEKVPRSGPFLATVDVSFISLRKVWGWLQGFLIQGSEVLALVKPQFEAGPRGAPGGVVRDPAVHQRILAALKAQLPEEGFRLKGEAVSPLKGPKGNIEFFLWMERL